ncbi:5-formyltetrahydrofolate cyclo-ligase [Arthrobacter sp. APC 3897]|uniref:5-formyltetrahydrofolate cyclo-ligase n=1 Tax=Arthrobacter sp. APC 3897 TaxID=3035204 RepID=UPI0025B29008|nr:5-formyltetrahydrofolate cyclo-ligase [Arthrobacter sp. APC 3897]MDN3482192.1 5-formyltetrahydrofolate cyclo-ligase [Arthrobacter sp. APC 3897]
MPHSAAPKDQARNEYRRRRRELPSAAPLEAGRALASRAFTVIPRLVSPAATVAAYLSAGREPDTGPLLAELHARGYDVVVPVCEPDRRLSWCRWTPGSRLVPGLFPSVPEPAGPRLQVQDLPNLELLLIPALAVDARGMRMGKGGGYYDRFLAGFRAAGNSAPAVGVVYDEEFAPAGSWMSDSLDQPADAVLTPSQWTALPLEPVYS